MHINPDHFLQTDRGRVFTPERNRHVWESSYSALERTLGEIARPATVYLLVGPQGAGKSTWVKNRPLAEAAVYFDAILVKRSERAEILSRISAKIGDSAGPAAPDRCASLPGGDLGQISAGSRAPRFPSWHVGGLDCCCDGEARLSRRR